jgi:hypothetical protein
MAKVVEQELRALSRWRKASARGPHKTVLNEDAEPLLLETRLDGFQAKLLEYGLLR